MTPHGSAGTRPARRHSERWNRGLDDRGRPRWLKARTEGRGTPFSALSLATRLTDKGRFARPSGDARSILSTLGCAFHVDAGGYARFLRGIAERHGVVRVEEKIMQR